VGSPLLELKGYSKKGSPPTSANGNRKGSCRLKWPQKPRRASANPEPHLVAPRPAHAAHWQGFAPVEEGQPMAGTPVAPNTQPQKDGDLLGTSNQDVQQVCVTLSIFLFLTLIVVTLPFPDCHHFRHPSHNTLCQEAAQQQDCAQQSYVHVDHQAHAEESNEPAIWVGVCTCVHDIVMILYDTAHCNTICHTAMYPNPDWY